jgi:mannose-6-phosphate isomerase-like protein (cupin superfamily)
MGDVINMTKHGATASVNVSSTDTNGAALVLDYYVPPHDSGPPAHWHAHTTEWWWVLSGTLAITVGEETITAIPGTSVYIPPRTVHTFWNPTGAPAAFLALMSPGGMERYFMELAALVDAEPRTLEKIAATYDVLSPTSL